MAGCVGCPAGPQTRCVVAPHTVAWGDSQVGGQHFSTG